MPSTQHKYDHPKLATPSVEIGNLNKATGTVTIKQSKEFYTQVSRRLKPYKAIPYKFKPAMEQLAYYLRKRAVPETFSKEGPGWHPLAKRTVNDRVFLGYEGRHPILKRSGDLFRELTETSHPKHIEIIRTGKKARLEFGGSSQKFIDNQRGLKSQRLPSRPMIPGSQHSVLPTRMRQEMNSIISKAIKAKITSDRV